MNRAKELERNLADVGDRLVGSGNAADEQLVVQPGKAVVSTYHDSYSAYPAAIRYENRGPLDWFADSAATQHMTYHKDVLRNFIPIGAGERTITGIKNTTADVRGIGDIHFRTKVKYIYRPNTDIRSKFIT
jgi:hypothetical protein